MSTHLAEYLEATATRLPDRTAVVDPSGRSISYAALNAAADRLAGFLVARGVTRADRVGVVLPKSIEAVVGFFAIMKAGAAYVPVDYTAPTERSWRILVDCRVRALIADTTSLSILREEPDFDLAAVVVAGTGSDVPCPYPTISLERAIEHGHSVPSGDRAAGDLAYILYTSGSTGIPKGVMLTHDNAVAFVDWCSSIFQPTPEDRFGSHAPFHFDLSVLDIYLAIKHGAALYLISEDLGKNPRGLAAFIGLHRLTVWYSTPSILTMLIQFGHFGAHQGGSLRLVLFAGEVFPVKHLRQLQQRLPEPSYYNLYGPTETNVCTFARIPRDIPEDRDMPYPIGVPCSHCEALVLDGDGQEVRAGQEGLLYISGPSVFAGYWNRPVENAAAFLARGDRRWYSTGDVVRWNDGEGFIYVGRRDRMVKRHGYRIELGDIERALYLHALVREAAVIALPDSDSGVKIVAFLTCRNAESLSIIELKTFCATKVPAYMIPDRFVFEHALPRTSTDKVDYQRLRSHLLSTS